MIIILTTETYNRCQLVCLDERILVTEKRLNAVFDTKKVMNLQIQKPEVQEQDNPHRNSREMN